MYGIFETKQANDNREEIITDITAKFDETLTDADVYPFLQAVAAHLNLQVTDFGDSISCGVVGARREYGAALTRVDGATYQLIPTSRRNPAGYEDGPFTDEDNVAGSYRRILRAPRSTARELKHVLDWLDEFNIADAIETLKVEIPAAVDKAETERDAIMTAASFPIYSGEARRIYAGIPLDAHMRDREVKAAFLARWHERTGR